MDLGLADRVYVVTGASRGLGRAGAEQAARRGRPAGGRARKAEALDGLVQQAPPARCWRCPATSPTPSLPGRLCASAMARYGRIDGALVSVGGPPPGSTDQITDEQWRSAFDSVFLGPLRLARAVIDATSVEGSSIVLVLSTSVRSPIAGLAVSNGLRPGLAMLVKTLADEAGPRGVRVNALLPGRIDTDRVRELDEASGRPASNRRDSEAGIPLRRYGEPAEFGRVATFVLSPAASYLTGAAIPVDGGATRAL
ncbi:oxidoreductase [Angustibacter aerolatus]|uniref:Oxidoreductase n=1 Tax=Angustibacter aerolatus TaxID=1162965 RepID=A0ABQ6JDI0_9ACTN|nr:SDR family oxidoreductase [Angustibacter aerolatus]GMA84962.1 oxidoreductase [Angustibacter aerolatus]